MVSNNTAIITTINATAQSTSYYINQNATAKAFTNIITAESEAFQEVETVKIKKYYINFLDCVNGWRRFKLVCLLLGINESIKECKINNWAVKWAYE